MAGVRQGGSDDGLAVEALDREIVAGGWQEIDLARTLGLSCGPALAAAATLSAPASAHILPFRARSVCLTGTVARVIPKKIPDAAFVSVGRPAGATGPRVPALRVKSRFANDNVAGAGRRSVWRDLFFLAVLAATVVGAFWSGRVHGIQKVIVVPGPSSFYSVVT